MIAVNAISRHQFEIVPGRSIGPFRLGMSREEVLEIARALIPQEPRLDMDALWGVLWEELALDLDYDEHGRCTRIQARIFSGQDDNPTFILRDHVVNNADEGGTLALFRSISPRLEFSYGSVDVPTAGLHAVKWESSDSFFFAIGVFPARLASEG
jgi:hypothetical protein